MTHLIRVPLLAFLAGFVATTVSFGQATGSGFIISPNGYIITCHHVIEDGGEVLIRLSDEKTYKAKVIDYDKDKDLALLKISAKNLPFIPVGNSDQAALADEVMALGFPLADDLGNELTVTTGLINSIRKSMGEPSIQTDLAVNPGNSGGPLIAMDGRVIGVIQSQYRKVLDEEALVTGERVNFAVPINEAAEMIREAGVPFNLKSMAPAPMLTKKQILTEAAPATVFVIVGEPGESSEAAVEETEATESSALKGRRADMNRSSD